MEGLAVSNSEFIETYYFLRLIPSTIPEASLVLTHFILEKAECGGSCECPILQSREVTESLAQGLSVSWVSNPDNAVFLEVIGVDYDTE